MNHYQLRILWFAIALGSLMLAFPPWTHAWLKGYAFFMELPRGAEIDSARLLLQLGILALVASGVWVTAKDERIAANFIAEARKEIPSPKDALGLLGYVSLMVLVGSAGLLLVVWNSPRGLSASVAVPLICIGVMALGVFLMTARHYFDSQREQAFSMTDPNSSTEEIPTANQTVIRVDSTLQTLQLRHGLM